MKYIISVTLLVFLTADFYASSVFAGDITSSDGAYIVLDSNLEEFGCQGDSLITNIGDNEKIGFAVYLKNCDTPEIITVDFSWDGTLASCFKNLTGAYIPDERIYINGYEDIQLAEEENIIVKGGGELLSVVEKDEHGHFVVTYIKVGEEPVSARDGLLCFVVFRTAPDFNRSDSLSIKISVTLRDREGNLRFLNPLTFYAESLLPDVTLTSPGGGEKLTAGCSHDITWTAAKVDTLALTIEYSADSGLNWTGITTGIYAGDLSYPWLVPDVESSRCLIRIKDSAGIAVTDESDECFTIRKAPAVSINLPDSEQSMNIPVRYYISEPRERAVTLKVEYSTDGGALWNTAGTKGGISALGRESYEGIFIWNAKNDLNGYAGTVQLRITPYAGRKGSPDTGVVYVDYNILPELKISPVDEIVSGNVSLKYLISDVENDSIDLRVLYSHDSGETWSDATITGRVSGIGSDDYNGRLVWLSRADLPEYYYYDILLKIIAHDGDDSSAVTIGPLRVDNSIKPGKGSIYKYHPGEVPVLAFHNIDVYTRDKSSISLTPTMLERIIAELKYAGCYFLSTKEYLDYINHGAAIPERSILVSFDDGYKSVYTQLFPLLKKHSFHASVSLITSRIALDNYLEPEEIKEMNDSGLIDFQSHSSNLHTFKDGKPIILQFRYEKDGAYKFRIVSDFKASINRLVGITGEYPLAFVIPYGVGNDKIKEFAEEAGFNGVFYIGNDKTHTYGDDPYHLDRITVFRNNAKVLSKLVMSNHYSEQLDSALKPANISRNTNSAGLKVRCAFKLPGGIICSSPAIGNDGTVYIGSWDNCLYAVNPGGTLKWKYETHGGISSSPAIGPDGTIYAGSYDRYVYAVNPDGTLRWRYDAWGAVFSSPAVGADGTIYTGSTEGGLIAINPDGSTKWNYRTGDSIYSSPSIGKDGTIYVGAWNSKLFAVNPDGTLKWRLVTGGGIESSPAIGSDGTIYVGCMDNRVYAVNPGGSVKWSYQTGHWVDSSPAVGENTVYIGSRDGCLYALNLDGTLKWKFQTGAGIESSPAIGSDGTIYTGSWDGYLYAVNPDGTRKWRIHTGGIIDTSPNIAEDGTIYFGSLDSWLYGIDSGTDAGLASSPWPRFRGNNRGTGFAHDTGSAEKIIQTELSAEEEYVPLEFRLHNPYPNPFNPSTTIHYSLPHNAIVNLTIYNVTGNIVHRQINKYHKAGEHSFVWGASGMPSGIYFCTVKTGEFSSTKKMLLLR